MDARHARMVETVDSLGEGLGHLDDRLGQLSNAVVALAPAPVDLEPILAELRAVRDEVAAVADSSGLLLGMRVELEVLHDRLAAALVPPTTEADHESATVGPTLASLGQRLDDIGARLQRPPARDPEVDALVSAVGSLRVEVADALARLREEVADLPSSLSAGRTDGGGAEVVSAAVGDLRDDIGAVLEAVEAARAAPDNMGEVRADLTQLASHLDALERAVHTLLDRPIEDRSYGQSVSAGDVVGVRESVEDVKVELRQLADLLSTGAQIPPEIQELAEELRAVRADLEDEGGSGGAGAPVEADDGFVSAVYDELQALREDVGVTVPALHGLADLVAVQQELLADLVEEVNALRAEVASGAETRQPAAPNRTRGTGGERAQPTPAPRSAALPTRKAVPAKATDAPAKPGATKKGTAKQAKAGTAKTPSTKSPTAKTPTAKTPRTKTPSAKATSTKTPTAKRAAARRQLPSRPAANKEAVKVRTASSRRVQPAERVPSRPSRAVASAPAIVAHRPSQAAASPPVGQPVRRAEPEVLRSSPRPVEAPPDPAQPAVVRHVEQPEQLPAAGPQPGPAPSPAPRRGLFRRRP
jgi:hypothetical protein